MKSNTSGAVDKEDDDSTDFVSFQLKGVNGAEVIHTDSTNPKSSKELAVLHNKLNYPDCFHIGLDDSRSIFDRGKYFGNLILSFGFKSDFGLDSKNPLRVHDIDNYVDGKVLVKMLLMNSVCFEHNFFFQLHTTYWDIYLQLFQVC